LCSRKERKTKNAARGNREKNLSVFSEDKGKNHNDASKAKGSNCLKVSEIEEAGWENRGRGEKRRDWEKNRLQRGSCATHLVNDRGFVSIWGMKKRKKSCRGEEGRHENLEIRQRGRI